MIKANVLITGGGAPGISGTIYSLKNNPLNESFKIVVSDINPVTIGQYFADRSYQLPPPEHQDYLAKLRDIVEYENIKIIIPQTTREIKILSKFREQIETQWGCKIIVSNQEAIERANDKYLIIKACEQCDVPCPEYHLVKSRHDLKEAIFELGYPEKKVVVKPRCSNGLRGVRIITEDTLSLHNYLNEKPTGLEIDLKSFLSIFDDIEEFPELLATSYMSGDEYTIDMLKSRDLEIVIPRKRVAIRSGISFETKVDIDRTDLIKFSKRLAREIGLEYCFGFQFKLDEEGIPRILESNPRVQGTMVASTFAGCNMIWYAVKMALGEDKLLPPIKVKSDVIFKRYWGGVGIDPADGKEIGRI